MLSVFARRSTLSLLLVSTVIIGTPARASFVQIFDTGVVTGTGTLSSDSAEAVFSWDAGTHQLEVALSNHASDLSATGQSLTGAIFGVTGGVGTMVDSQPLSTTTLTHSSATDTFSNITGSATNHDGYLCTKVQSTTSCSYDSAITVNDMINTTDGWRCGGTSLSGLTSFTGLFAGQGSGKPRAIVNDNIDPGDGLGDGPHNPWALATTFVLHVSGTPTALDLSHFRFVFGTGGDSVSVNDGTFSLVPEPGYYGALALGLSGFLLALHRRKKSIRS